MILITIVMIAVYDIFLVALFATFVIGVTFIALSWRKQNSAIRDKMEDLPVQDVIEEYKYNGKSLYLSVDDQRVWNTLTSVEYGLTSDNYHLSNVRINLVTLMMISSRLQMISSTL